MIEITEFKAQHGWDRNFFLAFIALCWLGVGMGFFPAISTRLAGKADYPAPPILHIHAAAFMGWLVLLTVQILLVRVKRVRWHQTLGLISVVWIPLMAVTAMLAEIYSERFYAPKYPNEVNFFIIPIIAVATFTPLAVWAIYARKTPVLHKRLILLATTVIASAAYSRWWHRPVEALLGKGYVSTFIGYYGAAVIFMGLAMLYDTLTRGRPHPVYLFVAPLLVLSEIASTVIYYWPGWLRIAHHWLGA